MPLSPEIERDIRKLEDKMRRTALHRTIRRRIGGGAFMIWLSLMIFCIGSATLPDKGLFVGIASGVGLSLLFAGLGVAGWGIITLMIADIYGKL